MQRGLTGVGTVVIAGATAACGLFLLGGVSPSGATGEVLPLAAPAPDETTTTTDAPVDTSTTSTTTSTTSSTSSVPLTTVPAPSIVPLTVGASSQSVGIGGQVLFEGTCDTVGGRPAGPVVVDVVGDVTQRIPTGIVADQWTYEWQAPTDPALIRSYTFQFWCGDPGGATTGYPESLQHTVDMVASATPAPAPSPAPSPADDPAPVIPATD